MSAPREPHNPFYLLLLLASVVFVINALAYGLFPLLEERAAAAGQPPAPSEFLTAIKQQGWVWLLWELGAMIVFAFASMGLDRIRMKKKQNGA